MACTAWLARVSKREAPVGEATGRLWRRGGRRFGLKGVRAWRRVGDVAMGGRWIRRRKRCVGHCLPLQQTLKGRERERPPGGRPFRNPELFQEADCRAAVDGSMSKDGPGMRTLLSVAAMLLFWPRSSTLYESTSPWHACGSGTSTGSQGGPDCTMRVTTQGSGISASVRASAICDASSPSRIDMQPRAQETPPRQLNAEAGLSIREQDS
jgi:hypothetical protein